MTQQPIRFDDGAAYERAMGVWSRLAGEVFLDWLSVPQGLRWIDVGCGNGAFTELLIERSAPVETQGIDPSEAQLAFARARPGVRGVTFQLGDAMALPFAEDRFDAAVMALAIAFVPDAAKGVGEMVRVVRPGGIAAAYMWDMYGGGFPFEPLVSELRALGRTPPRPPSAEASRPEALRGLWEAAGLADIEMRDITVQRSFAGFDEFWAVNTAMGNARLALGEMSPAEIDLLKARVRARLPAEVQGRITYSSRANAIKGIVPGSRTWRAGE